MYKGLINKHERIYYFTTFQWPNFLHVMKKLQTITEKTDKLNLVQIKSFCLLKKKKTPLNMNWYNEIPHSNKNQWAIQQLGKISEMLSERSQPQKVTYGVIPFIWCSVYLFV